MKKILVVDDSQIIRWKFVKYFKALGYKITTAENGREALEKVQKGPFDLILMDLVMPVMDGFEAIRRIREIKSLPFIPIIVISGVEKPDAINKALQLGANEYVEKPIEDVAFNARVQTMLHLKDFYENIQASERKYETLLQALPDVVYKLDLDGKFVFISDSIKTMGYDPQNLIGRHFSELVHPDDVASISRSMVLPEYTDRTTGEKNPPKLFDERRTINRATRNLEVRLEGKGPGPEKEGLRDLTVLVTMVYGEVASAGQYDAQGKKTFGTVGIIRDVTQRKLEEEELEKTRLKMIANSRLASLGELATGVAHEINQPLTYISGFAQGLKISLKKGSIGEINETELKEDLKEVSRQVSRIVSIVDHLRTFGRQYDVPMEAISIETTLENTFLIVKERIRLRNIKLISNVEKNLPLVFANSIQMEQVFINLFQNAIDSFEGKNENLEIAVDISLLDTKEAVQIKFEDNGRGIEPSLLDKIFEPFFTTKEVGKGTGLGLSIVYGIVKEHKGTITCDSVLNKGTAFTILLPIGEGNVKQ